jgi:hypothetical protein
MKKADLQAIRDYLASTEAANPWMPKGLLSGIAEQESSWNPQAVGTNKATKTRKASEDVGLMQINSNNFERLGVTRADMLDPIKNINSAVQILNEEFSRFKSVPLAVAAYNTGGPNVAKFLSGAAPLADITKHYVPTVMLRSRKFGGTATDADVGAVGTKLGSDLQAAYKAAGVAPQAGQPQRAAVAAAPSADALFGQPAAPESNGIYDQLLAQAGEPVPDPGLVPGPSPLEQAQADQLYGTNDPVAVAKPEPRLAEQLFASAKPETFKRKTAPGAEDLADVPPELLRAFDMEDMTSTLGPELDAYLNEIWQTA